MQTDFRKYPSPAYGDVQKEETEWKLKEKSLTQEKWKRLFPDGINVFCPFDGISATRVALDRLGIPVNNYYSSEIDKPAIAIAQKNYPDTIQLGDVCDISGSDLPKIDLMVGGSPCQGFSFAGDQLAFDDPRSALLFEFERLLDARGCVVFHGSNATLQNPCRSWMHHYLAAIDSPKSI